MLAYGPAHGYLDLLRFDAPYELRSLVVEELGHGQCTATICKETGRG